jgi:hypothetical protein
MGPPSYGRTQSQPYQIPLAMLERKLGERGERRQEESLPQVPTILVTVYGVQSFKLKSCSVQMVESVLKVFSSPLKGCRYHWQCCGSGSGQIDPDLFGRIWIRTSETGFGSGSWP